MDIRKTNFSHGLLHTVRELCIVVFNIRKEEQLDNAFGLNYVQLESVLDKIVDALPNIIFTQGGSHFQEEIKNIIAREFIFFQVQEKWKDQNYQNDLNRFIQILSHDIQLRIDDNLKHEQRLNEEK
jgi:hypothetical protein